LKKSALITLISIALLSIAIAIYYYPRKEVAYLDVEALPRPILHEINEPLLSNDNEQFLCGFENKILNYLEAYNTPGLAVAIVKNDKTIYKKGFGYRNLNKKLPVITSTVFRIGSVSKGFASTLTGLFEDEGIISWDDPVSKYLSDFNVNPINYKDSLTIDHLMSHSAGYPYQAYSTMIEDEANLNEMIAALQSLPLSTRPGYIHSYQNVAYSIIEKILEVETACNFKTLMKERIFDELKMRRASIDYQTINNQLNVALPHFFTRRGVVVDDISPTYYNARAAGGVNASIDDMAIWLNTMMGNHTDVISNEVLRDLFKPQIVTAVKNSYLSLLETPRNGHYGRGWRIIEYPSDTLVYHEGYVNGYKSAIGFSRTDSVGICLLSNSSSRITSRLLAEFFEQYEKQLTQSALAGKESKD